MAMINFSLLHCSSQACFVTPSSGIFYCLPFGLASHLNSGDVQMNIGRRKEDTNSPRKENIVDMARLANVIEYEQEQSRTNDYAPVAVRQLDVPIKQIKAFAELPTKEIDDLVRNAEEEIARLKNEAQEIRDAYVKYTELLVARVNGLTERVKLGNQAMKNLRDECSKLAADPGE
jgi:hypothetical protein